MEELKAGDCWAIGVIAYILIVGRPPFDGKDQKEIFSNIINKQHSLQFPDRCTASFKSFVQSLLSHDINQRLTAAQALNHPWIAGDGASTDHLSPLYIKFLQRFNRERRNAYVSKSDRERRNACIQRESMKEELMNVMNVNVADYLLVNGSDDDLITSSTNDKDEEKLQISQQRPRVNTKDMDLAEQMMTAIDQDDVVSLGNVRSRSNSTQSQSLFQAEWESMNGTLKRKISEHRFSVIMDSVDAI